VPSVLVATTPCIIDQQSAARGGILVEVLYLQSARRGRRGGVVLRTSLCTFIDQRDAELRK
jgi:hypothetical protein